MQKITNLSEKTIKFLEEKNINFDKIILKREPKSADDIKELFWLELKKILKTILFIWENEPVLLVLSWDKKVDIWKVKKITKQKNIRIAQIEEVKNISWYSVNWIGPFWLKNNIKKIIDNSVFDEDYITIWSGDPKIGLWLKSLDLKQIWDWDFWDFVK